MDYLTLNIQHLLNKYFFSNLYIFLKTVNPSINKNGFNMEKKDQASKNNK